MANLAESSMEVYCSKRAVLPIMMMTTTSSRSDLGEQQKPLISTVDVTAKIRTGHLPNVSQKLPRLSEHARLTREMR
jgi:hypothetical protein